jgi:hypothetical protein
MFVPSFHFTTTLSKERTDEFISVIMAEIGVEVFGYQKHNDEYWGKMKTNKNDNITFTLSFKKSSDHGTNVVINTFNTTLQESKQISSKICETIKIFEVSQSVYRKKHYLR